MVIERIESFTGSHRFLSNFWPVNIEFEGRIYPTVEHAYQASKSDNDFIQGEVHSQETPGDAKRYGFDIITRSDWTTEERLAMMNNFVRQKFFFKEPLLTQRLLQTREAVLIEGNNWEDEFWGQVKRRGMWVGANHLGIMLMKVRSQLMERRTNFVATVNHRKDLKNDELAKLLGISKREFFLKKLSFDF